MATRAFFLTKDEKVLDAITQILSDLDISFESVQDPSLAAKRIAAHHFDIILVDGDNDQNTSLVFGSAKNSGGNQSTIAIAIVDGKSGVANAFRLGASLVLSKPISMEQARGTLRNALAMVRKNSPEAPKAVAAAQVQAPVAPPPVPTVAATSAPLAPKTTPTPMAKPIPEAAQTAPAPLPKIPEALLKSTLSTSPRSSEGASSEDASAPKSKGASLMHDEHRAKQPVPPTFGMSAEKNKSERKTSPFLLAFVALALVAAGIYGYSVVDLAFGSLFASQFTNLRSMVGLAPKARPVAAVARPAVSPKPAAPANPPAATATTASTAPPDGFAQSPEAAPSQGFASAAPQKPATPLIVSTAATTQNAEADEQPLVISEDSADAHVTYRVQPAYPEAARKKGVKGSVVLSANVGKDGNVSGVQVVSGHPLLASAAVAALKQWRYEAYYHNGQATEFQTQVTIHFPQPAQR